MVLPDTQNFTITVDDLGVTLRTLLAAAGNGLDETGRRDWNIVYKGAYIGRVRVKPFKEGV